MKNPYFLTIFGHFLLSSYKISVIQGTLQNFVKKCFKYEVDLQLKIKKVFFIRFSIKIKFDEVDVGIGGATANVVGQLLRQLGEQGQVLCVTHQPQVAACAHHHLFVSKSTKKNSTHSQIETLLDADRTNEIARMLAGQKVTGTTLDHAKEMLQSTGAAQ